MGETKKSVEESFRESLEDVIAIAEKMGTHCKSTSDLTNMLKLALENDGQLSLILSIVQGKK